jgi:hypothetical protein
MVNAANFHGEWRGISNMIWIKAGLMACAAVLAATPISLGQSPPSPDEQLTAMKKLDFLVGQWTGEGWTEFIPGQRRSFRSTETVQRKLDGLLVTIEGLHRGQMGNSGEEVVVHNAFALISYDARAKAYRFQAFTARGNREDAEAKIGDGKLEWSMKIPQFGDVRYSIALDGKGQWSEVGEVTRDGKVRKFFEMTLRKAKVP